jgi:pimeloyl-ACP methyl ester carboxylesterase
MPIVSCNGTEIYYERNGRGEPLLLLPGLGLDHTYYKLGEPLLRESFETILVDPRGIGRSRKDLVDYSAELWADDFAALLAAIDLPKVHVLGSSLGGAVALAMGVRHPAKVKSLIPVGAFTELSRSVELNYALRKRLIAKIGMGDELAEFMGLWIMTRDFIETEAGERVLESSKQNVKNNSPELYARFLDAILRMGRRIPGQPEPELTACLRSVRAPTLVLCADNDHFIPAKLSKLIADTIPGAIYREIPGGGHIPFIEKPRETVRAVTEFIDSLSIQAPRGVVG